MNIFGFQNKIQWSNPFNFSFSPFNFFQPSFCSFQNPFLGLTAFSKNSQSSTKLNDISYTATNKKSSSSKVTNSKTSTIEESTSSSKTSSNKKVSTVSTPVKKTDLRSSFVTDAKKYLGYNEADGSSRKISKSGEWCADFIKYVINETYKEKGLTPPTSDLTIESGYPHLRVENIKQWGIKHNTYLSVVGKSNKDNVIANNVKAGDIMILRENKASHTGFVTKVYSDGSFDTIEGNRDDKVTTFHYNANESQLSGFVQVKS
jgi:hypothetical protein